MHFLEGTDFIGTLGYFCTHKLVNTGGIVDCLSGFIKEENLHPNIGFYNSYF